MIQKDFEQIFNESEFQEEWPDTNKYLDVEEFFPMWNHQSSDENMPYDQIFGQISQNIVDQSIEMPSELEFQHINYHAERQPSIQREQPVVDHDDTNSDSQKEKGRKYVAKSIATKNVCFNICQKTIRVIQKKEYHSKVNDLCQKYDLEPETFIQTIVKLKKNFTGPKALQLYIDKHEKDSQIFKEFMKWFLKEKYLRHCLKGDMKDRQIYIKFKNEVIMAILS